jgi:hypothetical protein
MTASYFDHLATRPVRSVPDSDGLCSYLLVVDGAFVSSLSPVKTTLSDLEAIAFLWPHSEAERRFRELVERWPYLRGAQAVRGRP